MKQYSLEKDENYEKLSKVINASQNRYLNNPLTYKSCFYKYVNKSFNYNLMHILIQKALSIPINEIMFYDENALVMINK